MRKAVDLSPEQASIQSLIVHGSQVLAESSDSAKLDSQILLAYVLNKPRSYLLTWPEKEIESTAKQAFMALLERRQNNEPIAYLVGMKEFWSLELLVSPATLIPRADTETLVELVLHQFAQQAYLSCLDLGTGTGAIALALASECPQWQIDAIDFNEQAVVLAQKNAARLTLTQVNVFRSDWFAQIAKDKRYQVIVANPPYIDGADPHLAMGDVRFEPKSALVADNKGLADIIHIATQARHYLAIKGSLFFEHGFEQGQAVRDILAQLGYQQAITEQDLNGNDRITWATYP